MEYTEPPLPPSSMPGTSPATPAREVCFDLTPAPSVNGIVHEYSGWHGLIVSSLPARTRTPNIDQF